MKLAKSEPLKPGVYATHDDERELCLHRQAKTRVLNTSIGSPGEANLPAVQVTGPRPRSSRASGGRHAASPSIAETLSQGLAWGKRASSSIVSRLRRAVSSSPATTAPFGEAPGAGLPRIKLRRHCLAALRLRVF